MSTALVVRTQRHKKIGDSSSPMVYTLKRKPQDAKIFDLARIAKPWAPCRPKTWST